MGNEGKIDATTLRKLREIRGVKGKAQTMQSELRFGCFFQWQPYICDDF